MEAESTAINNSRSAACSPRCPGGAQVGVDHHQDTAQHRADPKPQRGPLSVQQCGHGRGGQRQHTQDGAGVHRLDVLQSDGGAHRKAQYHAQGDDDQGRPLRGLRPGSPNDQQVQRRKGGGHHRACQRHEQAWELGVLRRAHRQSGHWQGDGKNHHAHQGEPKAASQLRVDLHRMSIHNAVSTRTAAIRRLKARSRRPLPSGPASQCRSKEPIRA